MEITIDMIDEQFYKLNVHQYNEWYSKLDKRALRKFYKMECPCGGTFHPKYKTRHEKSRRHEKYLNQQL